VATDKQLYTFFRKRSKKYCKTTKKKDGRHEINMQNKKKSYAVELKG